MLNVTDSRRFAAVVLMILSQLAGGVAVICDEGRAGQFMEFLPQVCCDTTVDGDSTSSPAGVGQDCGPCRDIPLIPFLQTEDEHEGDLQLSLVFVATLPDTPLTQLSGIGTAARDFPSPAAISTTVSQFVRTVVLRC